MLNMIKNVANDESGAVTVDWVVLTAAAVAMAVAAGSAILPSVQNLLNEATTDLATIDNTITLNGAAAGASQ
jgi:Flp pilus assembly pilin Flp